MIQMRALVAFDRNGKHVKVGDLFTAYPIEAASLRYLKRAEFSSAAKPAPAAPTYETRSMTAAVPTSGSPEGGAERAAAEPTQTADGESAQTTDGSRTRRSGSRQYANRSMRASEG